ncbi:(Fe-S)-binding protein [Alkalisalibacterium limincola]|nr:heterodisulfide reductase-related iron-sulfur binding cluster [Alkalisalibacterium limincola]
MISRRQGDCKPAEPGMLASLAMAVAPNPDSKAPGRPDGLLALADRCVQCGLCLPHCPTYQHDRNEAESPRGRIALWRGLASGQLAASAATDAHLDHCLGCRACESACPAGVRYGELLVAGRALQRERRRPSPRQFLVEWLAARPRWLAPLLGLYRRLHPALPARLRPLPAPPARTAPATPRPTGPSPSASVSLFGGCVGRPYDEPARLALSRLLDAAGIATVEPGGQTCCGALHAHAGDLATATRLAAGNRSAFARSDTVCATASGCQHALARSLEGSPAHAEDPFVLLARVAPELAFRPARRRVALHLPCTQQRVDGSVAALRALLQRIPELDVVLLDPACCGAAGVQMVTDPGRAAGFREPLLAALDSSGADTLLSANVGCRLHLGNASPVPVRHPLEFLAEHLQ